MTTLMPFDPTLPAEREHALIQHQRAQRVNRDVRIALIGGVLAGGMSITSAGLMVVMYGASAGAALCMLSGALLVGCAIGLRHFHRGCAVAIPLLYLAIRALMLSMLPLSHLMFASLVTILFLTVFIRGVRATFAHHTMRQRYDAWALHVDATLDPRLLTAEVEGADGRA